MDHHYDLAIIGMGCAGSHVVLELIRRQSNIKVVVLDDFQKGSMDKTWSFWEIGTGKWDHLVHHRWEKGAFIMPDDHIELTLTPYLYKSIESSDFIAFAKAELQQHESFTLIEQQVKEVLSPAALDSEKSYHQIIYGNERLFAHQVLDSRVPHAYFEDQKSLGLKQHFEGWVIKTEEEYFDPSVFTMMDYRLRDPGTTSFTYVLPHSSQQALVEFTYFSKELVKAEVYAQYLKDYIRDHLKIDSFEIIQIEKGVIPMTTYNFNQHHKAGHLRIGTAGGWVKPSTGYSFKSSEKKAIQLVENIFSGDPLYNGLQAGRFKLYDDIMIEVLFRDNEKGPEVFHHLYKNNPIDRILRFLDEESSFSEEIAIMLPMTSWPFLRSFFNRLWRNF
ncbi:lycopene cyclase family protein [Nonlabens xiamenensis]|uniref:lycopene cyclase family protein n=1 Tax=Nonlabens xiamenensis TaxID=2341043 RepID=UPI000F60F338|nr:lycopene cyclase family protein [Nonlabens xiamenensis]